MTELVHCDRHQAVCGVTLAGIRKAGNIRFLGKPQLVRVEVNVATAATTRKERVGENRTRPVCSKDIFYCVQESVISLWTHQRDTRHRETLDENELQNIIRIRISYSSCSGWSTCARTLQVRRLVEWPHFDECQGRVSGPHLEGVRQDTPHHIPG